METKTVKLGDIAEIKTGPFGSALHNSDYVSNGVPIITVEHIGDLEILHASDVPRVNADDYERLSAYRLKAGDIVFSRVGAVDRTAIVRDIEDGWLFSGRLLRVRPNPKLVDAGFLNVYFSQPRFRKYMYAIANGSTMPSINTKILASVEIELPSMHSQKVIAWLLQQVDEKQKVNQQINENLLRLMNVQWKNMFGSLNAENGHFTDLATVAAGGTPSKKQADYFGGDISWITPKDMSLTNDVFIERGLLNITEAGLRGSSAKLLPKGTLLFSSRAPIGYLGIAANPVTTNQGFKSLVPKRNENTEYLYFLLKNLTSYIEGIAGGSTFKEISGAGMKSVEFPLPTDNQIDAFHNIVTPMFDMVRNNEQQNKKLTDLRDLLLPRLLAGDIDLSNIETVMNNA